MHDLSSYIEKNNEYFGLIRLDILKYLPTKAANIFEIGCGKGFTALEAKKITNAKEVIGIELYPDAADEASKILDRVITGDIEELDFDFSENYFDCIIAGDVLEHLKNPWNVLMKIKKYLSYDGVIIASIPNIRHLKPLSKIIFDKMEYEESGIFDKTHLRFFTLHTIKLMFQQCGYKIININKVNADGWKANFLRIISFGILNPFLVNQYIVIAKK